MLHGLLGNNNEDKLDDVDSRYGDMLADINDEKDIFDTTETCNLSFISIKINK
jgi:hypothetical protein